MSKNLLIIIVISSLIGFKSTSIIYVIFSFLLFVIIVSWFAARPVVKNEKINPPPQLFFNKNIRITIQIIILLFDITIFFELLLNNYLYNRFNSCRKTKQICVYTIKIIIILLCYYNGSNYKERTRYKSDSY